MNETKYMQKKQKPELLAPAGSTEALAAAISAGADAVYFGGKLGNARLNAKNFTNTELIESLKLLHNHGKKGYITLNTVHTDREIMKGESQQSELLNFIEVALLNNADAFILQDIGLAEIIGRYFPTAVLHASTQAAAHNSDAAIFLANLGFSRIICARELSAKNLNLLIKNSPIEVEMFIHGALCSSHSGRCYFSYALGGTRSANRGACAQPCRLNYKTSPKSQPCYPLSLKDLSLAAHMTELLRISPCSLKIEGRMKSPEYVYTVTKIYRLLLDEGRNATNKEVEALAKVFSRSGFTDGYFMEKLGSHMYGIRTEQNKAISKASSDKFKLPSLDLKSPTAITESLATVKEPLTVVMPANARFHSKKTPLLTLIFSAVEQLAQVQQLLANHEINNKLDKIFFPLEQLDRVNKLALLPAIKSKLGIRFPLVVTDSEMNSVTKAAERARSLGFASALIDNIGHIECALKLGFQVWGSSGLAITNSFALNALANTGLHGVILSYELNFAQMRDIKKTIPVSALVYGNIPLMISENCLIKNAGQCKAPSGRLTCPNFSLIDRRGEQFPVLGEYGHRNVILNSVPVYWADKKKNYENLGLSTVSLFFTIENVNQISKIINDYALDTPVKPPAAFSRNGY